MVSTCPGGSGPFGYRRSIRDFLAAYDKDYVYVLTWGGIIRATYAWVDSQVDEIFVILPPEYKEPGFAQGFNGEQLYKDFKAAISN